MGAKGGAQMPVRTSTAEWKGDLKGGTGVVSTESGLFTRAPYNFVSRFEEGPLTNPEELIGAAHAGCFSMAFAADLSAAGFVPDSVATQAKVHIRPVEGGFAIKLIELETEAVVPGIDESKFQEIAAGSKVGCPVSKALASVEITLKATLKG
jgi:osmotically inducible protein OsmC